MKRTLVPLFFFVVTSLLLAACGSGPSQAKPNTLTAIRVSSGALDANASFWGEAPALEVPTVDADPAGRGGTGGPVITLQAAYDETYIYLRAEWEDPTQTTMKHAWLWNGTSFEKTGDTDEDRLMLLFPITNNAEFASKGCATACHNSAASEDAWWMGSDSADVTYDLWHWMSSRSNPVGYASDQMLGPQTDPANMESAHVDDSMDGSQYVNNRNDEKTAPLFMNASDLSAPYIFKGSEVAIDTSLLKPGDVVPGYILNRPNGSRGDIDVLGVWKDGKWIVVFRRLLNTAHVDDVVFLPPKLVPFGISVVDNGGGEHHTVGADVLILEWN